jgi:hypothetical protein
VVVRGDDAGSSRSANRAILEAYEQGILRNASILVPAPFFAEAADLFRDLSRRRGLCLGLHACVTAEWREVRWGPVLGASAVPSLCQPDGTFYESPGDLARHGPSAAEIMAEVKAQLDKARASGLPIAYMDEHQFFGDLPGVRERLKDLARDEGLVYAHGLLPDLPPAGHSPTAGEGPIVGGAFADSAERLIASLAAAPPGRTYLLFTHPAFDDPETRAMTFEDRPPGQIALLRDQDRRMLTDPRVVQYCRRAGVRLVRFSDLKEDA